MADYVDLSQVVTEVLSFDDAGTNYLDLSQIVVEVLVFHHTPVYARLETATDGYNVRLDSASDGYKIKIGD